MPPPKEAGYLEENQLQLAITTLWVIWRSWNKKLHSEPIISTWEALDHTRRLLSDYDQASFRIKGPQRGTLNPDSWRLPLDSIQIDFDGAIFAGKGGAGVGVVARNAEGKCVGSISEYIAHVADPFVAKCLAAREAIDFSMSQEWKKILLVGDSLALISRSWSESLDLWHEQCVDGGYIAQL